MMDGREIIQVKLRLTKQLHTTLRRDAKSAGRSLNAEVIERITRPYRDPRRELLIAAAGVKAEVKSIQALRLGERVAQIDTMIAQIGADMHKIAVVWQTLHEWRSLSFWARIKRVLRG